MIRKALKLSIIILTLSLICFGFGFYTKTKTIRKTPTEWVRCIYERDSIEITQKEPRYAEVWLKKNLSKRCAKYKLIDSFYDESMNAYAVYYKFQLKPQSKTIYKQVWIRFDFKINEGDYIITPKLVKLQYCKTK